MTSVVELVPSRLTTLRQPTETNLVLTGNRLHNLPLESTPLVGRESEIGTAVRLLVDQCVRLVTLSGPGGVGKTRIALSVARRISAAGLYPDGVWFVDLSGIRELQDLAPAICEATGDCPEVVDVNGLCEQLRNQSMLLVLDNFEQLLPRAALAVARLLAAAPGLAVLVTSRSPLYVTWEHLLQISPLALPGAYTAATRLDRLVDVPSVALLLQRARAAGASIPVTVESAPPLIELVRRSGGLPLAIELCAPQLAMLTPAEVLERSATDCADEGSVLRDLPARHQSLSAALEWSYTLLNPREQAVFRQVTIFAGSWTLDGAVAVAAGPTGSSGGVAAALRALIDAGLVIARTGRETRYTLLEPTRRYAFRLLSDALDEVNARQRWRSYLLDLVRRAELAFQTGDQASHIEWVDRLSGYWPDLRVLIQRCLDEGQSATALEVVIRLERFWRIRGSGAEVLGWLSSALVQSEIAIPLRIRTLLLAGELAGLYADSRQARRLLNKGLALAREYGDGEHEAIALMLRAGVAVREHDSRSALDDYDESLIISRTITRESLVGAVLAAYAQHVVRGDNGCADGIMCQALSDAEESPDLDTRAFIMFVRAELASRSGERQVAAAAFAPGLSIAFGTGSARLLSRVVEAVTTWPIFHRNSSFAAEVLGAIGALRERRGLPPMDDEPEWLNAVRYLEGELGHECFRTSFEHGAGREQHELITAACAVVRGAKAGTAMGGAALSEREQEVLRLVAEGKTSKQIGLELSIAERTVKAHVTNILNKLGVMTRAQALGVAVRERLI